MSTIRVRGKWSGKMATAIQWDGYNILACSEMAGVTLESVDRVLRIPDDEGVASLNPGDWLVKPDDHDWVAACVGTMFWALFQEIEE